MNDNSGCATILSIVFFWLLPIILWIVNLIQFFDCDFCAPYKDEAIHLVGILIPYAAYITVWY